MTTHPTDSGQDPHGDAPGDPRPASSGVNPNLSASLSADYEALKNDMEQARELAADFQRQLAGKSNEFAQLKQLFEKTLADLAQLQEGIVELRAERHRLANESMRVTAYQLKLAQVTAERDRLRVDLEVVRQALAQSADKMEAALRERDAQITSLVVELVTLKDELSTSHARLVALESQVASQSAPKKNAPTGASAPVEKSSGAEDFIEISFGA